MDRDGLVTIIVAIAIIAFSIFGFISFAKSDMSRSCTAFASQSKYETKYVEYTYWSFDCIAKQSDGKWISTSMLRSVTQE